MGAPPALRGIARALLVRRTALLVAIAIVAVAAEPASGALPAPVSSGDPFASCTAGSYVGGGTNFPASEVEPFVAADPKTPGRLVAVWQQDRWSGGGARGEVSAYSTNGGASWNPVVAPFGACADPRVAVFARLRSVGDDRAGRDRLRIGDRLRRTRHGSRRRGLARRRPNVERGDGSDPNRAPRIGWRTRTRSRRIRSDRGRPTSSGHGIHLPRTHPRRRCSPSPETAVAPGRSHGRS